LKDIELLFPELADQKDQWTVEIPNELWSPNVYESKLILKVHLQKTFI
jgi:hypothetical protein